MDVKPFGNRVVIEPDDAEEKTQGGIIIPDESREKPMLGTVKAIGPDVQGLTWDDRVMYAKFGGSPFPNAGKEWIIISQDDIFGLVSGE